MKLYATVSSERATKGQGGNKKLDITILYDEDKRQKLLDMSIEMVDGKPKATLYTTHDIITNCFKDVINAKPMFPEAKSEKQKGELCKKYHEQALPDENGKCSLCGGDCIE